MPSILPGGIRLRRPLGLYEHSVAYDWDPTIPGFSGADWAAEDPEGKLVYVGMESQGGSLSVTNTPDDSLPTAIDWVFPLDFTPGQPNGNQHLPPPYVPGSYAVIVSEMDIAHGTQAGRRVSPISMKVKKGVDTNIVYVADTWYRLYSIKTNEVELLTSGEVSSYNLALPNVSNDIGIVVSVGVRQDISGLGLSDDVIRWLMGFEDAPLAPTYYNSYSGRVLELTEQYWINANPTTTNLFEGGILKVEKGPVTTNFNVTSWMTLNGTNVTELMGDGQFRDAVFKVTAKQNLADPLWTMLGQFVFTPDSFDSNHTSRVLLPNPFLYWFPGGDPDQLFFRWVIEYEDPRFSKPELVNTNTPAY